MYFGAWQRGDYISNLLCEAVAGVQQCMLGIHIHNFSCQFQNRSMTGALPLNSNQQLIIRLVLRGGYCDKRRPLFSLSSKGPDSKTGWYHKQEKGEGKMGVFSKSRLQLYSSWWEHNVSLGSHLKSSSFNRSVSFWISSYSDLDPPNPPPHINKESLPVRLVTTVSNDK